MRDLSCFGDASVGVLATVSGGGGGGALDRSLQAAITSVYSACLSSGKGLLVRVTWTRTTAGAAGVAVAVEDDEEECPFSSSRGGGGAQAQHVLRRKRGSVSLVTGAGTAVAVYWDVTAAEYDADAYLPEPSGGDYCLAVVAESAELVVLLGAGEAAHDVTRRFGAGANSAGAAALVSRREQLRGGGTHATRCRFREGGEEHEVAVRACGGGNGKKGGTAAAEGEVRVSIDGEEVAAVRRVGWGFRGNRAAVLADGEVVDVMWDVHDWWFGRGGITGAGAQFMVRARAEKEGRLWMVSDQPAATPPRGFFLHVQCYRR